MCLCVYYFLIYIVYNSKGGGGGDTSYGFEIFSLFSVSEIIKAGEVKSSVEFVEGT